MSINNAMNTGIAGMSAEGQALGVVGDNVANTNTIGYKQSRALFEDVLGGAMGTPGAVGAGVRMTRAQQIFAQGSLLNTGQPTDLALSGDGFFVVHGTLDGLTGDFYTRAGQNTLSSGGQLVDPNGLAIQGYGANPDGTFGPATGSIQVPTAALQPHATSKLDVTANLDSTAAIPATWDPQNPGATSNFSTSMTVYDSLGNSHAVNVYFDETAAGSWDYHALVDGGELAGGTAGQNVDVASGTLSFTTAGALQSVSAGAGGTVDFNGATAAQPLNFNFGNPISNGGTGLGGTTQFAASSSISSQSQDGYASGSFTGIQIDSSGVVNGVYSNGQKLPVAQLVVAKFRSNDGLGRAGHNVWVATRDSGDASLGTAGSGGRPSIVAGALEQSNVDIAQQFVDLIGHQRAFQANSKTITTVDEMLQDIVNLKR
jgi:flagellar hook protein FlgE